MKRLKEIIREELVTEADIDKKLKEKVKCLNQLNQQLIEWLIS